MSEKKVRTYKEEKRNRTTIMKKEKQLARLRITAGAVCCAALIGWFGWSVYEKVHHETPNMEGMQVTDGNGNTYRVEMNEDGTANLVLTDSGSSSVAESVVEAVSTAESIADGNETVSAEEVLEAK